PGRRSLHAVQAPRHDPRNRGLARSPLAREYVAVRDALQRNGVCQRRAHVLLADQLVEALRAVLAGDDLVHAGGEALARLRGIRGTQGELLPLLPSGPGGVRSLLLHGARSLTLPMLARAVAAAPPHARLRRGPRRGFCAPLPFTIGAMIKALIFDLGRVLQNVNY